LFSIMSATSIFLLRIPRTRESELAKITKRTTTPPELAPRILSLKELLATMAMDHPTPLRSLKKIAAREEAENEAKVQEYLARQAELALIREDVEKARASGTWHPDELFLYERLAMRSFEELLPQEWQIDFRTLPELLFTKDDEKTFINSNCISRSRGKF
jgi:hypothetical protein